MQKFRYAGALAATLGLLTTTAMAQVKMDHVLLISVDGLHGADLEHYVGQHPHSALAAWSAHGVTYSKAMTSMPSDSFPGLLSLITGGSPRSTGVWYDAAFAHDLAEAKACKSGMASEGAEYDYSEALDVENKSMNTTIDKKKLLVDPMNHCRPVYPHSLLRTNTIFEVIKAAGHKTAWADKHPAYDLVNGPSGKGVDDLYLPEISVENGDDATESVEATMAYDTIKVRAIVNELRGMDHTGSRKLGVPTILGMNFQAVSVGQKLAGNGYLNAGAEPSPGLASALDFVDSSLGILKWTLDAQNLSASTMVIVTAKHGQSPIDPTKRKIVDGKLLKSTIANVGKDVLASLTTDDIGLVYLNDKTKTADVVKALEAKKTDLAIDKLISGAELATHYADPAQDPRAPDIIIQPVAGVIYTKPTATKLAEHGGGTDDDRHVALLIANPSFKPVKVEQDVTTTQVAPTILKALGLDPSKLDAVKLEKTGLLPVISDVLQAK